MGIEKSALKITVAESFVSDIEKRCERSRHNIYRYQGAHKAFQEAEELLNKTTQSIRNDFVGGKINLDLSDHMNIGKFIVENLMKVSKKFHDLSGAAFDSIVRSEGEVRGLEIAVEGITKSVNNDRARIMTVAKGIESGKLKVDENQFYKEDDLNNGRPAPRAVGTHPGPPMKAKRKVAKKEEEKKSKRVRKAAPAKKKKVVKKKTNAKNT